MNQDYDTQFDSWPFWLTLGGQPSGMSAQSEWLVWVVGTLRVIVAILYFTIAARWWMAAWRQNITQYRHALMAMAMVFTCCAVARAVQVTLMAVPIWSVLVASLVLVIAVSTWYLVVSTDLGVTFSKLGKDARNLQLAETKIQAATKQLDLLAASNNSASLRNELLRLSLDLKLAVTKGEG